MIRGDNLRELFFEVRRYLEVLIKEQKAIEGTRFESSFKIGNQIEDLQELMGNIQAGKEII